MDRTIKTTGRFIELARSFGAEEFVAVAKSATREVKNRYMILFLLRPEAQQPRISKG